MLKAYLKKSLLEQQHFLSYNTSIRNDLINVNPVGYIFL